MLSYCIALEVLQSCEHFKALSKSTLNKSMLCVRTSDGAVCNVQVR